MLRLLRTVALVPLQLVAIIAVQMLIASVLSAYLPAAYPGSNYQEAVYYVRDGFLTLLIWDRFYGPYSTLLRGVAKALRKSQQ
jgi:hypothetical protein